MIPTEGDLDANHQSPTFQGKKKKLFSLDHNCLVKREKQSLICASRMSCGKMHVNISL